MEHPKDVGDQSQLAIMLALRRVGYALLVPVGENTRYDLVIDDGGSFWRVQCKTGRLRQGAVVWNVCSSYAHHPNPKVLKRDYRDDVDSTSFGWDASRRTCAEFPAEVHPRSGTVRNRPRRRPS